jgi:hypothetical protein
MTSTDLLLQDAWINRPTLGEIKTTAKVQHGGLCNLVARHFDLKVSANIMSLDPNTMNSVAAAISAAPSAASTRECIRARSWSYEGIDKARVRAKGTAAIGHSILRIE